MNHAAHSIFPPGKGKYNGEYYSDKDGDFFWNSDKDSWEWYAPHEDGYKYYEGQYRISLLEQGWDYVADNYLSPLAEGGQIIGHLFKASFYDLPKRAIELGRADNIRIDKSLTVYEIKDGIFHETKLNSSIPFNEKMSRVVYPTVKTFLAPVSFGTNLFNSSLINFGINGYLKAQMINQIKIIEQQ